MYYFITVFLKIIFVHNFKSVLYPKCSFLYGHGGMLLINTRNFKRDSTSYSRMYYNWHWIHVKTLFPMGNLTLSSCGCTRGLAYQAWIPEEIEGFLLLGLNCLKCLKIPLSSSSFLMGGKAMSLGPWPFTAYISPIFTFNCQIWEKSVSRILSFSF